jgi:TonB family protein
MNHLLRSSVLAVALLSLGATSLLAESPDTSSDRGPKVISVTQPIRPRPMFNFGLTGKVGVTFTITAAGDVTDVKIHHSNDALLDKPVIDAIKQWKFSPAVKNGQAVAVMARQTFVFDSPDATTSLPRDLPAAQPAPKTLFASK